MNFSDVEARLRVALARPLPGLPAQLPLAPRPRPPTWQAGFFPDEARRAAALLLVYPIEQRAHVALTVRAADLPLHRGQVSLPGGGIDHDETVEHAALREAQEELGVDPTSVRVLGRLTPVHISVSGVMLHPVVAVRDARPAFSPASREVARLLEVSIETLADPTRLRVEGPWFDDDKVEVPFFDLDGDRVWGATAMVLSELLHVLELWRGPSLN